MLNKVIVAGRITKELVLRATQIGTPVLSFSIACERDFGTGEKKAVDFIDCVAWKKTAEFINTYFSKGKMILLVGSLQQRSWTDKDGKTRTSHEVIVESAYFGESKQETKPVSVQYTDCEEPGELPF